MKNYSTGIIFGSSERHLINKLPKNDDFYFTYRDDASFTHWECPDNESTLIKHVIPNELEIEKLAKSYVLASELIICAYQEEVAENVRNLVYASNLLISQNLMENKPPGWLYEITNNNDIYNKKTYTNQNFSQNLVIGCTAALNAWGKENLIYSLEKYRFSLEHDSFTPNSSSPHYGQIFNNFGPKYRRHVNAGYAFFSAYSIIEELGLEIRSSSKKQRFIKDDWNPIVKEETLERLRKIGIKNGETIYWNERGEETELQKAIKPKLGEDAEYNIGNVRDKKLQIIEALHYASFIRNFFVAHKFTDVTKFLSPYDIHNVQRLTRYLLIHQLGLSEFFV